MDSLPYRKLLYASAAVIFGVMGQAVARGWLARDLTGNNTGLGGVMLAFGIAMLVATPWGGVAADRLSKRLVLMLNQTTQEAMRVIAPALAGALIGLSWFGVGGVFLLSAAASALACAVLLRLPAGLPHSASTRSPIAEMADAFRYVRARPGLGLVALTTIGVVVIAFPYLTFLPTLADERYDVGAGGYGLMAGVAGFGAVVAGIVAPRQHWVVQRPWPTVALSGAALGASLIALGLAGEFWLGLVALLGVGAAGLVFQTTTQSLMLSLSDPDYHGRMQSMVVLGFSGFGLAALPLGLLADAVTLELTIVAMGVVVLLVTAAFAGKRYQHRRMVVAVEYI